MVFIRLLTRSTFFTLAWVVTANTGCATHGVAHPELQAARDAYTRAIASPAAMLAPEQLMQARESLARAEAAVQTGGGVDAHARDLAYIAQREAQLAQATGAQLVAARQKSRREKTAVALDDDEDDGDSEAKRKKEEMEP